MFVWQQQAEEPQGHANERKAFQQAVWGGAAGVGSSHGYQTSERRSRGEDGGESAGKGSLRGQGSELSRDPTTTNAALIFGLFFHRRPCKNEGRELTPSRRRGTTSPAPRVKVMAARLNCV